MFVQKKMKSVISIIVILLMTLAMVIVYNSDRAAQVIQAQTSPSSVAKALLGGLVSNDKYMLNAIVVPEQRDEVAKWLATHKPFYCTKLDALVASFPDLTDANFNKPQIIIVDEQPPEDANTVYVNALYSCLLDKSSFGGLNFHVYEIVIEKRDKQWYVKSWDRVCEVESVAGCM